MVPGNVSQRIPEPTEAPPTPVGEHRRLNVGRPMVRHLESRLVAGLLVLLPILVTLLILQFFLGLISGLMLPILSRLPIPAPYAAYIEQLSPLLGALTILCIIYVVGLLVQWAYTKLIIDKFHDIIGLVPVIGQVYSTTRFGIDFLTDTRRENYRGVVLLEFPRLGVLSIGLITSNLGPLYGGEEYLTIYIPTTPVPSSGYLVLVPASQVTPTDISVEEAMRMIISGGILAGDIISQRSITNRTTWPGRHWLRCSSSESVGKKPQSPLLTERAESRQDLVSK